MNPSILNTSFKSPYAQPWNKPFENPYAFNPGFAKGGIVAKTGPAMLHKDEMVVPKHLVKKVPKSVKDAMKKGGARNM